jgi:hypothetical protein
VLTATKKPRQDYSKVPAGLYSRLLTEVMFRRKEDTIGADHFCEADLTKLG